MAKKTQRRAASRQQQRDSLGCMWGFMNMFSFRHGPMSHKLLVDPKHGSAKNNELEKSKHREKHTQETNVGGGEEEEEQRNVTITIIKPSVKKLIAEELFIDKEIKKKKKQRENDNDGGEAGQQLSDSEIEGRRKRTQRKKNKIRKQSCDNFSHHITSNNEEPRHRSTTTRSVDIDNMIEELYTEIHRPMTNHHHKREDYKERLRELVKFLISQKLLHGNRPQEHSEILTSKDLMEVFQILGSDEELFLKLLQDPEILVPRDSKWSSFFKRKDNNNNNTTPEMSDATSSDRIFVLKPRSVSFSSPDIGNSSPDSHLMRNNKPQNSNFFLSEIKRRLKHAMKKEQQPGTKEHFFLERRTSKKKCLQEEDDDKKQRVSNNIYTEAKKHLSEMLNNGETESNSDSRSSHVQRTLGKILSFPEYLSPLSSPGRRWEQSSTTSSHRKSSSADFVNLVNVNKENSDIQSKESEDSLLESLKPISSETTEKSVDIEEETANKDDVMITKEIDIVPEETSSTLVDDLSKVEAQDEPRDSKISKQISNVEESQQAPVSSSSVASPSHCLAKTENGQEWSSPISVLEPLFVEDDISPPKMRSGEPQIEPWCIHFDEKESTSRKNTDESAKTSTTSSDKELVFNYIRSVLEAIDSNLEELYLKAQFSDQLLEPSLISNIPFYPNQLCPDHEHLFDCINEVVMELCCCPPWFSRSRRVKVFSTVKSIVCEVQETVYWHLLPLPLPRALDQIVNKDLATNGGNWLDLRCEIDWIGFEMSELILDELLEEFAEWKTDESSGYSLTVSPLLT